MAALWGLFIIGFAVLSKFMGVRYQNWNGPIYREQDPDSFRKAIGVQIVIGLLFIIGWFVKLEWHVFE
jgi:hypothetical protein